MSCPSTYYIRRLEPAVQSALLTRIRALNEPDEDTAFELFEAAKKYLYDVVKESKVAAYLINRASSDLGWGDYRRDHTYSDAYRPHDSFIRSNPIHENVQLAYNELQNGNPLLMDSMLRVAEVPSDAVDILYMIGFPNAVYDLASHGREMKNIRNYCRGLNMKVLVVCAKQTLENLVYVFGLLRRRCPELVTTFYYEMNSEQNHHFGEENDDPCPYYDCIHCTNWIRAHRVISFIEWWSARNEIAYDTMTERVVSGRHVYNNYTSVYRQAVVTWLLCARGLCHKDIARAIGKQVYESRFDLENILKLW